MLAGNTLFSPIKFLLTDVSNGMIQNRGTAGTIVSSTRWTARHRRSRLKLLRQSFYLQSP